jgi:hypothetical protein
LPIRHLEQGLQPERSEARCRLAQRQGPGERGVHLLASLLDEPEVHQLGGEQPQHHHARVRREHRRRRARVELLDHADPVLQPLACDHRPPAIALQQAVHQASADERRPVRVCVPQRLAAVCDRRCLLQLSARLVGEAEDRQDQPAQRVLRHVVEQREGALERLLDLGRAEAHHLHRAAPRSVMSVISSAAHSALGSTCGNSAMARSVRLSVCAGEKCSSADSAASA